MWDEQGQQWAYRGLEKKNPRDHTLTQRMIDNWEKLGTRGIAIPRNKHTHILSSVKD